MKWKLAANMAALVMSILGIEKIPIENSKVSFDDDQKKKLQDALAEEKDYDEMLKAFNRDIADAESEGQREERLRNELRTALRETNLTEEEIDSKVEEGDVAQQLSALTTQMKNQKTMIEKLMKEPEGDSPIAGETVIGKKAGHSATHLFGGKEAWNAFAGRPWNQRAAGIVTGATDFTDGTTIEKLDGDLNLYYRENPDEIKSLERDNFGLPTFWPKRLKVDDRVADGTIVSAEITQARKLPWLPKNKQLIKAEEGRIFPVQIDIEFVGYFLQKIEASWLNMMNKEGSQPYKTSFVRFLVAELSKKARVEDRISTVKGVYVETPETSTIAGKFINRQDGLLYQFYKARNITKKYKPFALGTPTTSNIVDYVDQFIESLPLEVRVNPDLVLYLSPYWMKAYKRRYEQIHGTQNDYTGYPENPKDYNNISFEVMPDLEGHDFMFITFSDNIELLENVPAEKAMYRFEYLKRIIYIWADYKQGVRLIHIGNKIADGDPLEFKVQSVWSNDVPIFRSEFAIPVFDDGTGEIDAKFGHLKVADDWATVVTKFNNTVPGQIIKLQGNVNLAASKNVTSAGNLVVGSSFDLKSGGTLTFFVKEDGTIKEISRTTSPAVAPTEEQVIFSGAVLDASAGSVFKFDGVANAVITNITGGVEGQEITVFGETTGTKTVTFGDVAGKIDVASAAVLALDADEISLVNVGGVWYESARAIS